MKEIKLFVDFEFTSLSPDSQPISIGVVSEDIFNNRYRALYSIDFNPTIRKFLIDHGITKEFYAEFSDFEINRCDDWVKENVVKKLKLNSEKNHGKNGGILDEKYNPYIVGSLNYIKSHLLNWLTQFSDYHIQFVVDCGTFDWYWLLQLIAEWEMEYYDKNRIAFAIKIKKGLPKLPSNISQVPLDLNDLIAFKKGISISEAFDLNREELAGNMKTQFGDLRPNEHTLLKHISLWDAKVIKAIYEKLK